MLPKPRWPWWLNLRSSRPRLRRARSCWTRPRSPRV
ncbi:unnamed protein product [Spirodela intermedia]|uniref:Uncharacterized protein n=1 Tax=Spirodela intermedia TaxID=51605 RepID=A0A7I8IJ12_SPIIN|nr:unnamed protein product [Spirodela intermedia]CAA6657146.1 unnamed protein product [Spirodela intermedia]